MSGHGSKARKSHGLSNTRKDLGNNRRNTLGIIILVLSTSHDFISILTMNGYDEFLEE
jgi:hypothetical protein